VIGGIYPPTWGFNVVVDEDGGCTRSSTGTVTDVASGVVVKQNPIIHRDKVILFANDGTTAPKKNHERGRHLDGGGVGWQPAGSAVRRRVQRLHRRRRRHRHPEPDLLQRPRRPRRVGHHQQLLGHVAAVKGSSRSGPR
jgi:hypothetical protein